MSDETRAWLHALAWAFLALLLAARLHDRFTFVLALLGVGYCMALAALAYSDGRERRRP